MRPVAFGFQAVIQIVILALSYTDQGRLLEVREAADDELIMACRYDSHQELVAVRTGTENETLHFYQGNRLSHTLQDQTLVQCLLDEVTPLGQQQSGDDTRTLLLLTDSGDSVIGEHQVNGQTRTRAYSPYGEQVDDPLLSLLADNGELREAPGWYLLGRGYRAYNPALMRFHSPDSLSPFGEGGLNPYMYCHGNPISFRDPTGHGIDDQGRPGGNPGYLDPPEEPKKPKKWLQWLGVGATIAVMGVTAFFVPWSMTLTVPMVLGMAALAVQAAGAVYQIIGVATEDPEDAELGGTLAGIGVALAGVAGVVAWHRQRRQAKAEERFYLYNDRNRYSFNTGKRPSLTDSAKARIDTAGNEERDIARNLRLSLTGPREWNVGGNAAHVVSPRNDSMVSLASVGVARRNGSLVRLVRKQSHDLRPELDDLPGLFDRRTSAPF